MYFSINKKFTQVKYFNNVKILLIILIVDCIFKAINLPRIKEKTYKKLSKPFTLLVLVCLLKNVFLMIVLVPVALEATKNSLYFILPVGVSRGK